MKNQILKLTHIRKRERKSLFLILIILLFSSFCDELYLSLLATSETAQMNVEPTKEVNTPQIDSLKNKAKIQQQPQLNNTTTVVVNKPRAKDIDVLEAPIHSIEKIEKAEIKSLPKLEKKDIKNKKIDPNQPNLDDILSHGISKKVAHTWINYTDAGGKFYKKEDLLKIYGITEKDVDKIASMLSFPEKTIYAPKKEVTPIHINKATAYDFAKISGIGPVLSERIIKFRDRIGGFHKVEQLREVYGVEEEVINDNLKLFVVDSPVKKININTCDEKQLGAHSYCSYRVAKAIINYRKQHGNFTKKEDLLKIRIVDAEWLNKISPYIEY